MKRVILVLVTMIMGLVPASAKEKRTSFLFGDITGVNARGPFSVYVTRGASDKVTVVYDDEIENDFKLDVRYLHSGTLSLQLEQSNNSSSYHPKINVYLEMDDIVSVNLWGSKAVANFIGDFTSDDLSIDLGGGAVVENLKVNGKSLQVCAGVNSTMNIEGTFQKAVKFDVSGFSDVSMTGNSAKMDAILGVNSAFKYIGNTKSCKVNCSGISAAELIGQSNRCVYECSVSGKIDAQKFICKNVSVEMSGNSTAIVNGPKLKNNNVSAGSNFKWVYYGDAELHNLNETDNIINGR